MTSDVLAGKVWRFDHDISTDLLSPGAYAVDSVEVRKQHVLESVNPSFVSDVQPGDVLVVGRNFGCGSSRETAAENLVSLGIACIVAESLARIFMRNAVALGLPVVVCPGVHESFDDGEHIEIDLASGRIVNVDTGAKLQGDSLPPEMREILASGGILAVLRAQAGR